MMARELAAAFAVAVVLITLGSADGAQRFKRRRNAATSRQRAEFLRNMRAGVALRQRRHREARFMEHVMSKAVPTSSFAVPSTTSWTPSFISDVLMPRTPSFRRRLEDGGDDAVADDDAAGDDAGDDMVDDQYGQFGFDVTAYSLKYIGCSSVRTYSDEMAEAGNRDGVDTVLLTMRFVIFRLCPTDYCSENSKYGCSNGYGEYIVQMEDYLEGMAEFNERKLQTFCEYCEQCINADEEEDEDGGRRLDDAGDDAAGDDAANDDCEDYDFCYANIYICEEEEHDDDGYVEPIDYAEFFECREVENANGNNNNNNNNGYFVGPHCASDGHTITVGLYSDEFCSEYVGAEVDIVEYTGLDFEDDGLAEYHPDDCISCKESDIPYQQVDEDEEDQDEVMELCERMYEESGKCNRYIGDADEDSYESYQQDDNEQLVCNYIKNLITGSYDEDGYIVLDEADGVVTQITSTIEEISIGQIFGLIFTVLGCVVMLVWACILHRAIIKNTAENAALVASGGAGNGQYGEVSRQNSGIVMGRSRSGGSYTGGEGTFA